jgi:hypothetical protein
MKKSDLDALMKRLEKCEKKSKKAKDLSQKSLKKLKKWKPVWIQMQRDIEELKKLMGNKLDCSMFDEEMQKMRDLINSLQGKELKTPLVQAGPSMSSKDLNDIKEAMKKIVEHDEKIAKL